MSASTNYKYMEQMLVGALVYLILTYSTTKLLNLIEKKLDEDEAMMLCLDNGAEDFIANEDNYEIYTSTEDFIKVKAALEEAGVTEFITSEITYVANNLVELDEETTEKVLALSDALDEIDDVQNVYHNLDA